jgi:hypothetical protein
MKIKIVIIFICLGSLLRAIGSEVKTVSLDNASVEIRSNQIVAKTGKVSIEWQLARAGLKMTRFSDFDTKNLINSSDSIESWRVITNTISTSLINISADISDDEGFTNRHIRVRADFQYAGIGIDIRYEIWVFPGAKGIRTQLFVRRNGTGQVMPFNETIVESMQFLERIKKIEGIGYYNDTQNRNIQETPILRDESYQDVDKLNLNWANLVFFRQKDSGIILVKESPKCVNQQSINTGGFRFDGNVVSVYGSGLDENSLTKDFQPCWATWIILYRGSESDMQQELKKFDRVRYPINKDQDIYVMANTWGSGEAGVNSKYASREKNILTEIESASDLGIDVLQIDDGWQGLDYDSWQPVKSLKYLNTNSQIIQKLNNGTEYDVFPEGWKNVRSKADSLGIKLGLWAACWIPYDDMVKNYKEGNFNFFKLDFAKLNNYDQFYDLVNKVRKFSLLANHNVRINWDVTENDSRMGYYFGHEYGNIFLENRKPQFPRNVVYHPYLVLRDAWHVAHYTNLNKFQVSYQNVEMVDTVVSDAYRYSHDYCLAITLMATPLFFQETHLLSVNARKEVKDLIQIYKQYRVEMYDGYVYPIGDEPSNLSWTGFQNVSDDNMQGYLLIFRERLNLDNSRKIALKFLSGRYVELKNLKTGNIDKLAINKEGTVDFFIDKSGDYRFYKYNIVK